MRVGSLGRTLAAVVVGLLSLAPSLAWAKKPKPHACPGGVFTFAPADAAAIEGAIGRPASAVALTSTSLQLADCSGTARLKARGKATSFKAKLPSCGGLAKLKIRGTIATPSCTELHATLTAKGAKKLPLAATRGLPPTTHQLIARALAEGRIDYPTSLAYRTWAFFLDPQLPPEFDAPGLGSEDISLFEEIQEAWTRLPAEIQADLAPYVARPDDPASAFGAGPAPAGATRGLVRRDATERRCPNYWTHVDAAVANVRVWDCSSGDAAADAAFLGRIAALFDKHWPIMTGDMGPPLPDDGVSGSPAIDAYLIEAGSCIRRNNICRNLEPSTPGQKDAIALAVKAAPFVAVGSGGEKSSGFMILKRERAVAADGDLDFESDVIHEFFHVLQFAHTTKASKRLGEGWLQSFFTEGSATWSEWMYLPEHSAVTHQWWSGEFLEKPASLLLTDGRHEYSSYIWPFFIQQERRAPEAIFTAWAAADGASGPDDVDAAVDQQLAFKTNFRRFALRNLNWKPPGHPLETVFGDMDPRFPTEEHPAVGKRDPMIKTGLDRDPVPVEIQSLMAQYQHFEVDDHVRKLVFDFQVDPQDALDVDALVKVDGTWKRIRSEDNTTLEFCRVDPEERVDEIVLVLSNHARNREANGDPAKMTGNYFITASESCAAWSGSFRYVYTDDEVSDYTDSTGEFSKDDHFHSEGTWRIIGVAPAKPGDLFDSVDTIWTGTVSLTKAEANALQLLCGPAVRPDQHALGNGNRPAGVSPLALGRGSGSADGGPGRAQFGRRPGFGLVNDSVLRRQIRYDADRKHLGGPPRRGAGQRPAHPGPGSEQSRPLRRQADGHPHRGAEERRLEGDRLVRRMGPLPPSSLAATTGPGDSRGRVRPGGLTERRPSDHRSLPPDGALAPNVAA